MRLRSGVLCAIAWTAWGVLALPAAGALVPAGEMLTDTVESVASPLQDEVGIGLPAGDVVEPAIAAATSSGTTLEPVTSPIEAAGEAAAGATEAVLAGTVEAVGGVAEPPAGDAQSGGVPEGPPIEPPPVASPPSADPPAVEPPPVASEPEPRPVDGSGVAAGSGPDASDATSPPGQVSGGASSETAIPGGSATDPNAATAGDLVVWPAPSVPILPMEPTATPGSGVLVGPDAVESVAGPALSRSSVEAPEDGGLETVTAPWNPNWVRPLFALVDPRAPLGAVIFVVLGLGALSLAMAGIPRRAYAGVRLSQESELALRATLACAGLVLVAAAGIGQLAA